VSGVPRWTDWSEQTRIFFRSQANFAKGNRSIWISDEPATDLGTCIDFGLVDTLGNNCANYTQGAWCDVHAVSTPAGCTAWGLNPGCDMPGGDDENGNEVDVKNAAGIQCCQCGGGNHETPTVPSSIAEEIIF